MNQNDINQQEWENQANWGGPKWLSVYFSKRDTRIWVPKQIPGLGLWSKKATPNLAHTAGVLSFMGIYLLLYVLAIALALYLK